MYDIPDQKAFSGIIILGGETGKQRPNSSKHGHLYGDFLSLSSAFSEPQAEEVSSSAATVGWRLGCGV